MNIRLGEAGQRWCTPLIPALWRQRQVEFEVILVYKVSSRRAKAVTQRNPTGRGSEIG